MSTSLSETGFFRAGQWRVCMSERVAVGLCDHHIGARRGPWKVSRTARPPLVPHAEKTVVAAGRSLFADFDRCAGRSRGRKAAETPWWWCRGVWGWSAYGEARVVARLMRMAGEIDLLAYEMHSPMSRLLRAGYFQLAVQRHALPLNPPRDSLLVIPLTNFRHEPIKSRSHLGHTPKHVNIRLLVHLHHSTTVQLWKMTSHVLDDALSDQCLFQTRAVDVRGELMYARQQYGDRLGDEPLCDDVCLSGCGVSRWQRGEAKAGHGHLLGDSHVGVGEPCGHRLR